MNILFLDDNDTRHKIFMQQNIGNVVEQAWTARGAIWVLENYPQFDLTSLDHDLDPQATLGNTPLEETGMLVAKHIVTMPVNRRPKQVIVHSFNHARSQAMIRILRDAKIDAIHLPFGSRL